MITSDHLTTRIERHWHFVSGSCPIEERREGHERLVQVAQHTLALMAFVFWFLFWQFFTASFTLSDRVGPVRWDRGFKSTLCVARHFRFEGCGWNYVRGEEHARRDDG